MERQASRSPRLESRTAPRPSIHLLAGATSGFATAIVTSPLDVLRTRLQSDLHLAGASAKTPRRPPHLLLSFLHPFRETAHVLRSIAYQEGWRGFFRGLGPSLAGVVPAAAVKFYVYGNCKRYGAHLLNLPRDDSALVHAQAAVAAGLATATATNPIWLVKTRLQLDKSRGEAGRRYRNSLDCVRQVVRQEGVRGLYRGLSASYLGTVETALHLVLYEQLKVLFRRGLESTDGRGGLLRGGEVAHWISTSGAAGSAKLAAVFFTYPHEVVRTRLRQAPMQGGVLKYTGLVQCFRLVAAQEGLAGLYGGLMPHIARSIPSAIISLGVYEFVLRLVGQ